MLALFVKIPTMYHLRKIRSFSADSQYSADHIPLYFASHISTSHALQNPWQPYWQLTLINQTLKLENDYGMHYMYNIWPQA